MTSHRLTSRHRDPGILRCLLLTLCALLVLTPAPTAPKELRAFPDGSLARYSPDEVNKIASDLFNGEHINLVSRMARNAVFVKFFGNIPKNGVLPNESTDSYVKKNIFFFNVSGDEVDVYFLLLMTDLDGRIEKAELFIQYSVRPFDPNADYFHESRFHSSSAMIEAVQKLDAVAEVNPEFLKERGFRRIHGEVIGSTNRLRREIFVRKPFARGSILEMLGYNFNPNSPMGFCVITPFMQGDSGAREFKGIHHCGFQWSMLHPEQE